MDIFELWPGGPKLETNTDVYPVGTDSVLLSNFVALSGVRKCADLGCGSGIISLILSHRRPGMHIDLVDISPEAVACAGRNIHLNGLDGHLRVICGDLRSLREADVGKYQLIVSNPPYFPIGSGTSPSSSKRSGARQEDTCTLSQLAFTVSRLLGDGGRFAMCGPAFRLSEALCILSSHSLEPKRLRLVQGSPSSPPSIFLVECRRGGRPGVRVEPALIIKDGSGADTDEIRRIYHFLQEQ